MSWDPEIVELIARQKLATNQSHHVQTMLWRYEADCFFVIGCHPPAATRDRFLKLLQDALKRELRVYLDTIAKPFCECDEDGMCKHDVGSHAITSNAKQLLHDTVDHVATDTTTPPRAEGHGHD